MKDKVHEICSELNRGRIAVTEATEQIMDLINSTNEQFADFIKNDGYHPSGNRKVWNPETGIACKTSLELYKIFLSAMNNIKLDESDLIILNNFDEEEYDFYYCKIHGVSAIRKDLKDKGCATFECDQKLLPVLKSYLLSSYNNPNKN